MQRARIAHAAAAAFVLSGQGACAREEAMRTVTTDVVAIVPPEDAGRVLLTPAPATVEVRVRGTRAQVDALAGLEPIEIDLRAAPARVELSSKVRVPQGITLVAVSPTALDLTWDEIVARDVRVQVTVFGWPTDGFSLRGEPSADPPTVRVRGPRALVEALRSVEAGPLDVNNLPRGTHVQRVSLAAAPERLRYEALSVDATVEVVPAAPSRR